MTIYSAASSSSFTFASLIISSPSAGSLLPFVLDIAKPFDIRKPVTNADNTTYTETLKDII